MTATAPADWFALDLHGQRDHYGALAGKRGTTPVERIALGGGELYVVYRYADVAKVVSDTTGFSTEIVERRYSAVLGKSLLTLAPVVRRALRRAMLTWLGPAGWASPATVVEPVARRCVDALAGFSGGTADLVTELAGMVPALVITRLLGFDDGEWPLVAELASGVASLLDRPRDALRAARALRRRFEAAVAERRDRPGDDFVSALLGCEVDGGPLDRETVVASLLLLAWAGTETAAPAIASACYAVLTEPGVRDALLAEPGLVAGAVDEALRWEAPVQLTSRTAKRDQTLAGVAIPAGATVVAHLGSAGRDERRFAEPDRFDPRRPDASRHLAFGLGPHSCLGAQLATAEVATTLRLLLQRWPQARLAGGAQQPTGQVLRSPRRLPVVLEPAGPQPAGSRG